MNGVSMEHDYRELWDAFRVSAEPFMLRFRHCHRTVREQQLLKLKRLLESAAGTEFGRAHQFADIQSYDDFKRLVPVSNWASISNWMESAATSDGAVMTREAPLFFEPTSGSSSRRKLIPYTPQLLSEFQSAIIVWLASLYDACPAVANGRGYWSLSPQVTSTKVTANGTVIGGGHDAGYLQGSIVEPLLQSILNPPGLADASGHWREESLIALVNASDLSMMSVWSPTFLLTLLEPVLSTSGEDDPTIQTRIDSIRDRIDADRTADFDEACRTGNLNVLWPQLAILSTWTAGPSQTFSERLASHFPDSQLIPKGLLSTEGVISISYRLADRCPLALDSHFLEFISDDGSIRLADEIRTGVRYRPLLSTGGGLYRYDLGDVVEVEPTLADDNLICVRFVQRSDARSDMVGEKLDEALARQACQPAFNAGVGVALVPYAKDTQARYFLILDEPNAAHASDITDRIEAALLTIHHYAQARSIGQLAPVELCAVSDVSVTLQSAWETIGLRAGDFKPSVLITSDTLARAILASVPFGSVELP